MTPAEKIADDTWHKLKEAQNLTVRLGEETLTDLLILDMKRHKAVCKSWVYQTTKKEEAGSGTDLLVVVRDGKTADARLYPIQAKKLYPNGQYTALRKENDEQLDALEEFAYRNKALPYYLFYNYVTARGFITDPSNYWHCARNFHEAQLGCTLVPSWIVRKAIGTPRRFRPRSFEYMHQPQGALPWRCLFDCRHWERKLRDAWSHSGQMGPPDRGIPLYDWVNVDPMPGAWPAELVSDDVDLAPIAEGYVVGREAGIAPERLESDSAVRRFILSDRERTLSSWSRPPEFRPRRFIFVDKTDQ